jgi:hypothetical protein
MGEIYDPTSESYTMLRTSETYTMLRTSETV